MFRTHILKKNIRNLYTIHTDSHRSTSIDTDTINGLNFPKTDGTNNQLLATDGAGNLSFIDSVNLAHIDIITDDTPQLGGDLDLNNHDISGTGDISISGDITCSNITVNGTNTFLDTSTIRTEDSLIYLASGNTADTIDLGWYGKYVSSGTKYAGIFRDATDNKFKLFTNTTTEPTSTITNYTLSDLEINDLECDEITAGKLDVDNIRLNLNIISSTANNLKLTSASGSKIELDGTIFIDAGVITGATSITSTSFIGGWNGSNLTKSQITDLVSDLSTITSNVNTNISNITNHSSIINTNTANITSNGGLISANSGLITSNTSSISSNGGLISANSGLITSNTANIATNATNITNTASKWTQGTGLIYNTTDKVGIGTNNPAQTLHIKGSHGVVITEGTNSSGEFHSGIDIIPQSRIRSRGIRIRNGTTDNMRWIIGNKYNSSLDNLNFLYTSTGDGTNTGNYQEMMTIKTNGSVGIGTNNPAERLTIYENSSGDYIQARFQNANTSGGRAGIQLKNGSHTLNLQQNNGSAILENYGTGSTNFYQKGSGSFYFKTTDSNTNRFVILNNGMVGIGNDAPIHTLSVAGNALFTGDIHSSSSVNANSFIDDSTLFGMNQNNQVLIGRTNHSTEWRQFSLNHKSDASGVFRLAVDYLSSTSGSSVELFNIVGNGNVGVGTNNPVSKLHIHGTNSSVAGGGHIWITTAQDNYPVFQQLNWTHDNISQNFDSYYNGAWRMGDTGSSNSCCQWYKLSDKFSLRYDFDVSQGSAVSWKTAMEVNLKTGDIGIGGANSSLYKLKVDGDFKCSDLETTKFIIQDNVIKTHHSGDFVINTANDLIIQEDGDVKMTMNSSGNLGIGTNSPDTLLHLHSTSSNVYTGTYAMGSDTMFKVVSYQDKSSNADGAVIGAIGLKRSARNAFINFHRGGGDAGGYMTFTSIDDTQILKLKDNVETPNYFVGGAGSIICMEILEFTGGNNGSSNSFTDIVTKNYVKKVASSRLFVEIKVDYTISGHGNDTFESRIKSYDGTTADYGRSVRQLFKGNSGGGSRSGDLNACFLNNSMYSVAGVTISYTLQVQRNTANDTAYFSDGCFKVFEIAI